jgi:hypothetical protein
LLSLAEFYGWQPAGTTTPELQWTPGHIWNGGYFSNDGQTVAAADAHELAAALERALPDIPDEDLLANYRRDPTDDIRLPPIPDGIDERVSFSGVECKSMIRDFIKYCRGGEFQIY